MSIHHPFCTVYSNQCPSIILSALSTQANDHRSSLLHCLLKQMTIHRPFCTVYSSKRPYIIPSALSTQANDHPSSLAALNREVLFENAPFLSLSPVVSVHPSSLAALPACSISLSAFSYFLHCQSRLIQTPQACVRFSFNFDTG